MEVENQRQPFLFRFSGGLGVYPQRKVLRGFCKTFRPKKVFERMGMKKPQCFLPDRARLLKCPCAKNPLSSFVEVLFWLDKLTKLKLRGYGNGWGARAECRRFLRRVA